MAAVAEAVPSNIIEGTTNSCAPKHAPPDYSTLEYWEKRFSLEVTPFDWLKQPEDLLPWIEEVAELFPPSERQILHIGSGSSKLSFALRDLVSNADQIHNIDFSNEAIELGKAMELSLQQEHTDDRAQQQKVSLMRWSQADLLDVRDLCGLLPSLRENALYDMIIDKSTSDAIACGIDVDLDSSLFDVMAKSRRNDKSSCLVAHSKFKVHPMWLLALNLATVASPGAAWIAVSYSRKRFPWYLPGFRPSDMVDKAMPEAFQPWRYWILERIRTMTDPELLSDNLSGKSVVNRPPVEHWIFVMRRTAHPLKASSTFRSR